MQTILGNREYKKTFFDFGGKGEQFSSGAQGNRYPLEGLNGDGLFFLLPFCN